MYEDAVRIPLLIALPGGAPKAVEDVVEAIDVIPTLLELWGVPQQAVPPQPAVSSPSGGSGGGGGRAHAMLPPPPSGSRFLFPRSVFATSGLEALMDTYVPLDGTSLMPYLSATDTAPHTASRKYARSELHLPCGLGCALLNQPYDGLPPGYTRTRQVGPIVLLLVRTRRWAFTATLRGELSRPPLRLIDEQLFDTHADPGETRNLAYYTGVRSYAHARHWLLQTALRDWAIQLSGPVNASRAERAQWLGRTLGYHENWWKRR